MSLFTTGELSVAMTARSQLSNMDRVTEPVALALNAIPYHGMFSTLEFGRKLIGSPAAPFAVREPSMNRAMPASNRTVVPGRIVRVTPGRTVTCFVTTYTLSRAPHVVLAETYVTAAAGGVAVSTAPNPTSRTARTIARLGQRRTGRWAFIRTDGSR